jgi:SPP1 family predicted phage head-tail adaptor
MLSKLTQRATLEAHTLVPDGAGGYSASWDAIALVWCAIEPTTGADVFGPDAIESRVRTRMVIRRRTDVSAGMRVTANGRVFRIEAVLDDGPRAQFLTLLTEQIG